RRRALCSVRAHLNGRRRGGGVADPYNVRMRCRVKICGVTSEADAELAARLGADAVGLNFFADSPRAVSEDTARAILRVLPPFVEAVMLAVRETWEVALA